MDSLTQSETKSGSYISDGTVNNFHEWEFRTKLCMRAALASLDPENGQVNTSVLVGAVSKIVEGLRGNGASTYARNGTYHKVHILLTRGIGPATLTGVPALI